MDFKLKSVKCCGAVVRVCLMNGVILENYQWREGNLLPTGLGRESVFLGRLEKSLF